MAGCLYDTRFRIKRTGDTRHRDASRDRAQARSAGSLGLCEIRWPRAVELLHRAHAASSQRW
ncbi:Hypothetical protein A7982_02176 [Minicystis rosea]|nr:Hypothetical protein A7982_02176 [Minicystis rosea]